MITAIKIAGDQKNSPTVIDLDQVCPSCKDVQESFSKLKKLCLCSKFGLYLSRVMRKPVFGVSDQVRHKSGCTAIEAG